MGPGVGDKDVFEAEHEDGPEVKAVLGFTPTHAFNVGACCNAGIEHVATMDVIGGVAKAELAAGSTVEAGGGVVGRSRRGAPVRFVGAWTAPEASLRSSVGWSSMAGRER